MIRHTLTLLLGLAILAGVYWMLADWPFRTIAIAYILLAITAGLNFVWLAVVIGMMAFGGILAIPALVVLLDAAVAALMSSGMSPALAAVIVGGVALIIGLVLLMAGTRRLKAASLVPDRTIHQLQRDAAAATQEARHEHHRAA